MCTLLLVASLPDRSVCVRRMQIGEVHLGVFKWSLMTPSIRLFQKKNDVRPPFSRSDNRKRAVVNWLFRREKCVSSLPAARRAERYTNEPTGNRRLNSQISSPREAAFERRWIGGRFHSFGTTHWATVTNLPRMNEKLLRCLQNPPDRCKVQKLIR